MNDLLWLLYLADVLQGLKVSLFLAAICIGIGGALYGVIAYVEREILAPHIGKIVALVIALAVVSMLLPSRTLLYVAAGLRAGEIAAHTEQGQKALRLLDAALDKALEAAKGK